MENENNGTRALRKPLTEGRCEDCLYYDTDEDGEPECRLALDEDEYYALLQNRRPTCPYFRYYDEYKSVQKQI